MLRAGRVPFHEPGLAELLERNRDRLTFTLDVDELKADARASSSSASTRRRRSRATPTLSYVWSVIDELGDPSDATLVMKSTVPVGTGEKVRAALDQRGLERRRLRVEPRVPRRGHARSRTSCIPDRIVIGAFDDADGDRVAALYEGFDAPIVRDERRLGGDDQARRERVPRDADQLHQRDRERLARWSARTSTRSPTGMGLDRRIGTNYLHAGIGYGGSCFPKDVSFAQAARGNSRLPLPAAERRDRGQRAPEAARRRRSSSSSSAAARQDDRAARARVQAEYRRHARGAVARARLAAARRGRRRPRLGSARQRPSRALRAVPSATSCSRRCGTPTRR